MSLPKEPRQKMINMMYLVLTALLALNVSAEILNAFKTVDRSLMIASGVAEQKNEEIFKSFKAKLEDPTTREKAAIWEPKAQQARKLSDELYNYIEGLKLELKKESDLKTVEGINDFATMKEVVYRRYKRVKEAGDPMPKLIVIDGGKGQLSAALESIEALGLTGTTTLVGLAKNEEELFFANDSQSLKLP